MLIATVSVCFFSPIKYTDAQPSPSLNMVVFGDSIMWGQGLKEQYKFHSLVENHLKSNLPGVQVNKQVLAHSGAIIGKDLSYPLFSWDKVPGEDNDEFKILLRIISPWYPFGELIKQATIVKINDNTIQLKQICQSRNCVSATASLNRATSELSITTSMKRDFSETKLFHTFKVVYPSIFYDDLHREINTAFPTILQQVRQYQGPPSHNDVNLVLVDGCINDVGVMKTTNPKTSSDDITNTAKLSCYDGMKQLLSEIINTFPNAKIIVTGYYEVLSENSSNQLKKLVNWVIPYFLEPTIINKINPLTSAAFFVEQRILNKIIDNWHTFAQDSNQFLKMAVDELNTQVGCIGCIFTGNRISFANPNFGPENALLAEHPYVAGFYKKCCFGNLGNPLLYYVREHKLPIGALDEIKEERANACSNPGTSAVPGSFNGITCPIASIGHPNFEGSKKYAEAINAVLPPLEEFIAPGINIKVKFLNFKLTDNIRNVNLTAQINFAAGNHGRPYQESNAPIPIPLGQTINLPNDFEVSSTLRGLNFIGTILVIPELSQIPVIHTPFGNSFDRPPLQISAGKSFIINNNNSTSNTYTDSRATTGYDQFNRQHSLILELTYQLIV
jgi:hypothetical protein